MVQLLRPVSTLSYTSGINIYGESTCHEAVNEATPDTSNYIKAGYNGSTDKYYYAYFDLGTFSLPSAGDGVFKAYLWRDYDSSGSARAYGSASASLKRSGTVIVTLSPSYEDRDKWMYLTATIPSADLQALTDPSELTVEVELKYDYAKYTSETQGTTYAYAYGRCGWVEIEIPDAGIGLEMGCNF